MRAFEGLKRFFKPTDSTLVMAGDPFVALDRDSAIAKLKLDEKAERNGARNFPPADMPSPDDVEAEIIAEMNEHAERAKLAALGGHQSYTERLSELALLRELSAVSSASAQASGDYQTTVINRRNRLTLARDAIKESYGELADFKREHSLTRPAHRGWPPVYTWSAVVGSLLIESLFNTAFLRVNDEYGLLGGFIAAVAVSGINVFASYFAGRHFWPYLFYKRRGLRYLACAATAIWFLLLVTWNLIAGHFRDAKAAGMDAPEVAALGLFLDRPWQFDSLYSYGLLFLGVCFGLLSAAAGFGKGDPYPGYGAIYERHERRCEEYSDEMADALSDLRETRDDAISEVSDVRDQLGKQFRERGTIIAARTRHRTRFREHQTYLEETGNALLSYYRSANLRARTDGARPAHFDKYWKLTRMDLPEDPPEREIDAEVQAAQEALAGVIEAIAAKYSQAIESFDSLDHIKASLGR